VSTEATFRRSPIKVGEGAPGFTLPAVTTDGGEVEFALADALARGRLLLIFYQDDGMPICTNALKAFAQEYDLLSGAGVDMAAINTNGIGSHQRFQERDRYPFPLISDFYGEVVRAYGFWDEQGRKSSRAVVIIERDATVVHVTPHFNPGNIVAYEDVFAALGLV
jgi:peroxiredoxin Q/BCP